MKTTAEHQFIVPIKTELSLMAPLRFFLYQHDDPYDVLSHLYANSSSQKYRRFSSLEEAKGYIDTLSFAYCLPTYEVVLKKDKQIQRDIIMSDCEVIACDLGHFHIDMKHEKIAAQQFDDEVHGELYQSRNQHIRDLIDCLNEAKNNNLAFRLKVELIHKTSQLINNQISANAFKKSYENKDELGNPSILDITNSSEHQVLYGLLKLLLTILIPALILCCAIPSISPYLLMAAVLGTIAIGFMFFLYCLFMLISIPFLAIGGACLTVLNAAVLGREETTGPRQYLDAIHDAQLAIAHAERHSTPAILSAAEINLKTNVIFYP